MSVELPPLPEPNCCEIMFGGHRGTLDYFTADQMRSYARAAVDAALEAAAVKCDEFVGTPAFVVPQSSQFDADSSRSQVAMQAASAIRAMKRGQEQGQ